MFDVDRVITTIDFATQTFSYISKKAVLQDIALSDDQFLDLCTLAGGDHGPTFPPMFREGAFAPKTILDFQQYRNGFNYLKAFPDPQVLPLNCVCEAQCRTNSIQGYQRVLFTLCTIRHLQLQP